MKGHSGFTAFELAVTLAVVALIASLALPPYLKWLREHRLRGAVTNLKADLEMAKIKAIRQNSLVAVQLCRDSYTIFNENGDTNYTCKRGGREVYRTRKLPAGVKIDLENLTFSDDRIRFNGRGLPDGMIASKKILIKNPDSGQEITINRLGHMEVQ